MTSQRQRRLVRISIALVVLATPSAAHAAERFAATTGTGNACTQASPCTLQTALFGATAGDVVTAAPGTYRPSVFVLEGVTLRGTPGQARPRIVADDDVDGSQAEGAVRVFKNGIVRGIDIEVSQVLLNSFSSVTGLRLQEAGALAEQVRVTATRTGGGFAAGADVTEGATLRDSRIRAIGTADDKVFGISSGNATIVGTTVISDGTALMASACLESAEAVTTTVVNSIVRGGEDAADRDIVAPEPQTCNTAAGSPIETTAVAVSTSNFRPARSTGPITAGAGNQTAAPLLDATLAQQAGSPTIDAGVADARQGTADADGDARVLGAAVDIGGDEFNSAPPPPVGPAPGGPAGPSPTGPAPSSSNPGSGSTLPVETQGPLADTSRPTLSKVTLSTRKIKRRRSATLGLTLSEGAKVRVRIEQLRRGRRAGRSCSLKARRGKRCTVARLQRTITTTRSKGALRITVPTKQGKKVLAVGSYRLVITATDAAGNRSAQKTVTFSVRK